MAHTTEVDRRGAAYQALVSQAAAGRELAEAVQKYIDNTSNVVLDDLGKLASKVLGQKDELLP